MLIPYGSINKDAAVLVPAERKAILVSAHWSGGISLSEPARGALV